MKNLNKWKNGMKTFLLTLLVALITYILAPFFIIGITAWVWLPVVFFELNNCNGWLGLIIGLFVSSGTISVYDKLIGDN